MTRLRVGLLCLMLLPGLSACWVRKESGERMRADIVSLQAQLEVIKKAHHKEKAELKARLLEADKQIAELSLIIGKHRKASGRNAADFGVEIEQLKGQLMQMRGDVEVNQHRLGIIENRLSIIHNDLVSQKATVVQREEDLAKQREEELRLKAEQEAKSDPLAAINRPKKKEAFYKLAHGLLESGQTEAARRLFEEFLEKWPKGSYSDNAMYWIAESHYAEKKFRDAALAFQRVRKAFPKGDKAPDALLKLGYCFFAMDMYREALPFLRDFVQSYPRSPLVAKAKKRIREAERALRKKKKKRKKRKKNR